jgi:hypothetical protein
VNDASGNAPDYYGMTEALGIAPGERDIHERGPRATAWEELENSHGREFAAAAIAARAKAAESQAHFGYPFGTEARLEAGS